MAASILLLYYSRMHARSHTHTHTRARAADNTHKYTTKSHYPDTGPTSPGFITLINAERLEMK